jgi:mRNA interferase RelE/StbE
MTEPLLEEIDGLDKPIARRQLSQFWKYRVGDYRLICSLEHDRLVVLVLRVGHRREIYSR